MKAVAPGIYRLDNGSYRVIARVGDRKTGPKPREKRFPSGTGLRVMKRWQEDQRAELRRQDLRPVRGTLSADMPRYLLLASRQLEHPKHRESELGAWLTRFAHRRRDSIETEELEEQVREWRQAGIAASTIRHRLSALSSLYRELDGRRAYNPVADVERPSEPRPSTNAVPLEDLITVLAALAARVAKHNRGWKTLARCKVIALTGMRHSQVGRLMREDIWLDQDPPLVIVNKPGKDGKPHWKPLTAEAVAAFRLFIENDAFGKFSASSVYKSWKLACEEAGVTFFNPYRLRHTYATTLRAGGMDLADVQELVGHTSSKTTARYAMVSAPKLMTARTTLDSAWERAKTNVENARQSRVAAIATAKKTTA